MKTLFIYYQYYKILSILIIPKIIYFYIYYIISIIFNYVIKYTTLKSEDVNVYDDDFKITYYDSKTNYGIQLADLTVNTFYNSYKNIKLVDNVIKELKPKNFRVSLFPRNSKNKNKNLA